MKKKLYWLFCLFGLGFFSIPTFAQCPNQHDRHCRNLQYILYAAQTDFRQFQPAEELSGLGLFPGYHRSARAASLPSPDASFGEASVPCEVTAWMNGVAMYLCQGQASAAVAEQWYGATLADLQQLQYLWQFKIEARDAGHDVDAGPPGCQVAPMDGPYIADGPYAGQCPLHLQVTQEAGGTARLYLWLTSYTSPFLVARAAVPGPSGSQYLNAAQPASPAPEASQPGKPTLEANAPPAAPASAPASTVPVASGASSPPPGSSPADASAAAATSIPSGCGDLCRGLKKVLEERMAAFGQRGAASASSAPSSATSSGARSSELPEQLAGASSCSVRALPSDGTRSAANLPLSRVHLTPTTLKRKAGAPETQYVCYWPGESSSAAETRFRDLSALLEVLIPSAWSVHQETQTDELSGAKITVWSAHDAADRPTVGLYLSGQSVGLHISSASK